MAIGVTLLLGSVQMADSNNTQAAATAAPTMPADGPWNWAWDKLAKAAGNVSDAVLNAPQAAADALPKMPWEMNGSELAQQTQNKRPPSTYVPQAQQPQNQANIPTGSLFSRLVNTESGGNHLDASGNLLTSSAGARGITQLMPNTAGDPGYGVTPLQNQSVGEYLRFGKDYLDAMQKHFGNTEQAVAAYNAGPGTIQKAVAKAQQTGGDWKQYIPTETRNYVRKILGT